MTQALTLVICIIMYVCTRKGLMLTSAQQLFSNLEIHNLFLRPVELY